AGARHRQEVEPAGEAVKRDAWALSPTEAIHPKADAVRTPAEVVAALHREDLRAVRAVGRARRQIIAFAEALARCIRSGGRLVCVGAGTSGRLGALDAAEWPPTFGTRPGLAQAIIAGGPKALRRAVEEIEARPRAGAKAIATARRGDLVCGITASGTTPFVL